MKPDSYLLVKFSMLTVLNLTNLSCWEAESILNNIVKIS